MNHWQWYSIMKMVSIIRFAGYLYNRHAEIDHEFNFIKLHLNNRKKKCIRMQEKQSIKAQNKTSRIIPYKLCLLECCHRRADENNTNSAYFSSWSINHRFFRWQKNLILNTIIFDGIIVNFPLFAEKIYPFKTLNCQYEFQL